MSEWRSSGVGDVFTALAANRRALRAAEAREVELIARACDEWSVDESAAGAACERLVRGGADGTPLVGEFLALELAALLGTSATDAATRIASVLDLRHRHPDLWAVVIAGQLEPWKAHKVTTACSNAGLTADAARWVDHRFTATCVPLPWGRALRRLDGLIVQADTVLAAERAREKHERRMVHIGEHADGGSEVYARLDTGDALALNTTINAVADALARAGCAEPVDRRRATALGVLADPQAALDLLAGVGDGRATNRRAILHIHVAADAITPTDAGRGRSRSGAIAEPPTARPGLVARVEEAGPVDLATLRVVLAGCQVIVRPVIDLNEAPAVDSYEIPDRLRQAVEQRNPVEVFPYSSRRARGCDLDHTLPYDPLAPPGSRQTRADNLGPLSRTVHRAKTADRWHVTQPTPGVFDWTSPTGHRYRVTPDGTKPLGRTSTTR
jgi:hypothetical protein